MTDEELTELTSILNNINDWTNARDGSAEADMEALFTIRDLVGKALSLLEGNRS